ncbi:MAG: FAD-binding oxidoreductase [Marinilabiliales bacterium]|nr:MAG: FAD-binding oxidoreductase [Marinilabiliales bacterium]
MDFSSLKRELAGEILFDKVTRVLYATDASVYRELPAAVCLPANEADIIKLVRFASTHGLPVIPRGAGTSLAGQVVGNGIVADVSRYMNRIIELNTEERWVRVEPGVVLDELNQYISPHGLFFGPETSTSNRCIIGGMLGNNSCGAHSLIYGSTREHTLEVRAVLSDGSVALFGSRTNEQFRDMCNGENLESRIYRHIDLTLGDSRIAGRIRNGYPDHRVTRRNTGYALDLLLETAPFTDGGKDINLCTLLAGSEGTLAFATEIKLNLVPLPPPCKALVCAHFKTREEALRATLLALEFNPGAVEMMDDIILNLTRDNLEQGKNRFFIEGDPAAILIIEFAEESHDRITQAASAMEKRMRDAGYGYHFPVISGKDIPRVWNLRKAGLGVLSTMKGDAKPVSLIEDTSVRVDVLPEYIDEVSALLEKYGKEVVFHAHVGSGELHMRPVLNLKDPVDVDLFYRIGRDVALLVRKYRGSLSGEHGDGRLRGEFIPLVLGEDNYSLLCELKETWDPQGVFNPGKITGTPPMNTHLRYTPGREVNEYETLFDFSPWGGIVRFTEQCNGSGDCRKSEKAGGTMCPSFMATRDEYTTTRARANLMREFLTNPPGSGPFSSRELYDILDLCLSCKGCKSECPSNVDMAKLKAEFLQHWYDKNGTPLRARLVANITLIYRIGSVWPGLFNAVLSNPFISKMVKSLAGFAPERSIPLLHSCLLRGWMRRYRFMVNGGDHQNGRVLLFADEFTGYNDVHVGIRAVMLLDRLGYRTDIMKHGVSGRTFISKGFLRRARKIAQKNIELFSGISVNYVAIIGIEPSAILTFRDEYPDLTGREYADRAKKLAGSVFMIDEFIASESDIGKITPGQFTREPAEVLLHGHCQQKAVASTAPTIRMLSLPENYRVREIPSGCCGMAGSFGYEKEHYELSVKVGELVLFPEVRAASPGTLIAAPGTSCRHHITDGTGRKALHPVEIMYDALIQSPET